MTPTTTGGAARTQELTSYDSGTRTYTGTKSRVRFQLTPEEGKTSVTGIYRILVTPTVGDAYEQDIIRDYPTEFPTMEIVFNYPWIVGAQVYLLRWSFSYQLTVADDFQTVTAGAEFFTLPPSPSWPEPARTVSPPPNADAFDNFESAVTIGEDGVGYVFTGRGWDGTGTSISKDPIDAFDNFETYPTGVEITTLTQGAGWSSFGFCFIFDNLSAYDNFESYTTGVTITTLTGGTGWDADGRSV